MVKELIRFEDFELDRGAFELRRDGRTVRLERIPLELLFLLAERRGLLVGREEIVEHIWGKDIFVDSDNSINTAIRKIRQALGDNPDQPRIVQTVPGKGYRFAAKCVVPVTSEAGSEPGQLAQKQETRLRRGRRRPRWLVWAGIVVLLAGAGGLLALLSRRSEKPAAARIMLVVLPFLNLSGDPQQEYFADGMTEEMITQLGNLDPDALGVIARTSSMRYKRTEEGASQIARELKVDYLLEGSVRREGERVRVTAQLIRAKDESHLWAEDFDRDSRDVLHLQRDVALTICDTIKLKLEGQTRERLRALPRVNPEAHEAYLRGLHELDLRTKKGADQGIEEFQRAITLDSKYAAAFAGLARAYSLAAILGAPPNESLQKAREAALKAIALDDSVADGHTVLGFVKSHYEFDWPAAEREYRRGLELNPNNPYGHFFYSNSYLSPLGRHEEAIAEMKKAIEVDPFSAPIQSFLGRTYLWARRYDEALQQFKKCDELFPGFLINHERLSHMYTYTGEFEKTIAEETRARLLNGEDPEKAVKKDEALRGALKAGGARGYWKKEFELLQMEENPPEAYRGSYGSAILFARMGEKQKALDALEKALEERVVAMTEIGIEPALDPLRGEERFRRLLERVGLAK
jgi:TolB-like protein/DNA-binding winged helix-turn-helix (wHTH) protein